jgi:hypothetical protein
VDPDNIKKKDFSSIHDNKLITMYNSCWQKFVTGMCLCVAILIATSKTDDGIAKLGCKNLVRMNIDVNEHEILSNYTLRHKVK